MSHYAITGPALISVSGGRTSAYMLHEIVRAHGGATSAEAIEAGSFFQLVQFLHELTMPILRTSISCCASVPPKAAALCLTSA
jgi:hypothetical protein